jgi:hypothetical protein
MNPMILSARKTLEYYAAGVYGLAPADKDAYSKTLVDLLSDLRHFCDDTRIDFEAEVKNSRAYYQNEKANTDGLEQMHREGWVLTQTKGRSTDGMRIERYDEQTSFKSDADALNYVIHRAMEGSLYHIEALKQCNS